jgi:hypothetical protein
MENSPKCGSVRDGRQNLNVQMVDGSSALRIEAENGLESVCRVRIFILNVPQNCGSIDKGPRGFFDEMIDSVSARPIILQ